MKRLDALKKLSEVITDQFIVCNFGFASRELYHLRDRKRNFYFLYPGDLASSFAFGIAFTNPNHQIWCIESEDAIIKNLGILSTISYLNPLNLTLIVIDNGVYDSSDNQKTFTNFNTKLDTIARGSGFKLVTLIENREDIVPTFKEMGKGCHLVIIKTKEPNAEVPEISISPEILKKRFKKALLEKS